jgi:hypothetical protein
VPTRPIPAGSTSAVFAWLCRWGSEGRSLSSVTSAAKNSPQSGFQRLRAKEHLWTAFRDAGGRGLSRTGSRRREDNLGTVLVEYEPFVFAAVRYRKGWAL